MKKLLLALFVVVITALLSASPVSAASKVIDMPIIGAAVGIVEAPVSFIKNVVTCKGFIDCINLPKHAAQGGLNGVERIVGTTILPFQYSRGFSDNGIFAKNDILTNGVGWVGVGVGLYYTLPHAAHVTWFGLTEATSLATMGAAAGAAFTAIEMQQSGWKFGQ